ncbi:hypothetical protein BG006_005412, partial [Podila minutissima]
MPILSQLAQYAAQHTTRSNDLKSLLALTLLIVSSTVPTLWVPAHAVTSSSRLPFPCWAMPLMASIPGTRLYEYFEKYNNKLGPVWSISLAIIGRMIQCDTPKHVEHVLKTNFWNYEKSDGLRNAIGDLLGKGIFAADGPEWRYQRKLASHIFTVKAFKEYVSDVFVTEGQKVIYYLGKAADQGTVVDFHLLMLHFALDSFGTASLGKSFGCLDNMEHQVPFAVSFDDLTATCSYRLVDPAWRIRERLTNVGKKAQYDKNLIAEHSVILIKTRREQGFQGGKKDLFDPQERENLVREVDDVLHGETPSYESHKQQKYAEA